VREGEAVDHVGLGVVAHARVTTVPFGPPSTAIAPASMPDLIRRRLQGSCSVSPRGGLAYATPGRFPFRLVHYGQPPRPLGNKQRCVIGTITFPTPDCANNAPFASM
jgi:hypothetical protein